MKDILYKQLRELTTRKSTKFPKWLREKKGGNGLMFHHLTGSMGKQKLNDFLGVLVDMETHHQADEHRKDFCIDHLPEALNNLCEYVEFLESKS